MSKLFKILTLAVVLLLTVTLAACKDKEAIEKLEEDRTALMLSEDLRNIVGNLDLPTEGKNGSTITWSSDKSDIVAGDGTVTRPENGDGNATVVLTAKLKLDGESLTKDFTLRVLEKPLSYTIADARDQSIGTDVLLKEAIVTAKIGNNVFIQDDTGALYLYLGSKANDNLVVGNKVIVSGERAVYNGLQQLKDVVVEKVSENNTLPTAKAYTTIQAMIDANVQGQLVTLQNMLVTGVPTSVDNGGSFYVTDGVNEIQLRVDKYLDPKVPADTLVVGDVVTVTAPLGDFNGAQLMLTAANNITKVTVNDTNRMDLAKKFLSIEDADAIAADITLPTEILGTTVTWTSSNSNIIANDGTFTIPTADTDITLTATISYTGLTSVTKDITVTALSTPIEVKTVAEAIALADNTEVRVEGLVIANSGYGYVVYGDGEYGFVYTGSTGEATPGDLIVFDTKIGSFSGLKQLQNPKVVETKSTGNTLPTYPEGTLAELIARTKTAALVTVSVSVEGNYDNVYLTSGTDKLEVYYKSTPEYNTTSGAVLKAYEGQTITLPVYMYQNGKVLFLGTDADITAAQLTDAEKLTNAKVALDLGSIDNVIADITLPTSNGDVQITWALESASDYLTINTEGNLAVVTRPAEGSGNATVKLIATLSLNSETDLTKEFTVTILENVTVPSTVTQVLTSQADSLVFVEGTVSLITDKGYLLQDADGTSISVEDDLTINPVTVGDKVKLNATYVVDYGRPGLGTITAINVVSSNNAVIHDTTNAKVFDLTDFTANSNDYFNQLVKFEGTIYAGYQNTNSYDYIKFGPNQNVTDKAIVSKYLGMQIGANKTVLGDNWYSDYFNLIDTTNPATEYTGTFYAYMYDSTGSAFKFIVADPTHLDLTEVTTTVQ